MCQDFRTIGALVGKLLGAAIGESHKRRAIQRIVIKSHNMPTGAGGGAGAGVEIWGKSGEIRRAGERAICSFLKSARRVANGGFIHVKNLFGLAR